jgi:hypothetical protein
LHCRQQTKIVDKTGFFRTLILRRPERSDGPGRIISKQFPGKQRRAIGCFASLNMTGFVNPAQFACALMALRLNLSRTTPAR